MVKKKSAPKTRDKSKKKTKPKTKAKQEKATKIVNTAFSKKELQQVRKKLIEKKAEILTELLAFKDEGLNKSFKDASGDLSGYSFHMADMATDLYDRELSLGLAEGERQRLFALDDAIKRVDAGTYGMCDSCGCKIGKQRIKAMPQAKFCIKCQEEEEKEATR